MKIKIYFALICIILICTSCSSIVSQEKSDIQAGDKSGIQDTLVDVVVAEKIISAVGLIQTAGPTREYQLQEENGFQLLTNNTVFNLSYYLIGDIDLDQYWGKCVEVKGVIPENGQERISNSDFDWIWGTAVLEVKNIRTAENTICENLKSESTSPNPEERSIELLDGYIVRNQRPAPDYSYDYAFVLTTPENYFFIPEGRLPVMLDIGLFTLNNLIENKNAVRLTGYFDTGYDDAYIFVSTDWQIIQE